MADTEIQKGTQIAACLRAIASPVAVMLYLECTPFTGLEGSVVIAGNGVAAIAPLLAALEITNVGKTTSMGFGTLCVEFGA